VTGLVNLGTILPTGACFSISSISGFTCTFVRSFGIVTHGIYITAIGLGRAFIYISAVFSISKESIFTATVIASLRVITNSLSITVV